MIWVQFFASSAQSPHKCWLVRGIIPKKISGFGLPLHDIQSRCDMSFNFAYGYQDGTDLNVERPMLKCSESRENCVNHPILACPKWERERDQNSHFNGETDRIIKMGYPGTLFSISCQTNIDKLLCGCVWSLYSIHEGQGFGSLGIGYN